MGGCAGPPGRLGWQVLGSAHRCGQFGERWGQVTAELGSRSPRGGVPTTGARRIGVGGHTQSCLHTCVQVWGHTHTAYTHVGSSPAPQCTHLCPRHNPSGWRAGSVRPLLVGVSIDVSSSRESGLRAPPAGGCQHWRVSLWSLGVGWVSHGRVLGSGWSGLCWGRTQGPFRFPRPRAQRTLSWLDSEWHRYLEGLVWGSGVDLAGGTWGSPSSPWLSRALLSCEGAAGAAPSRDPRPRRPLPTCR